MSLFCSSSPASFDMAAPTSSSRQQKRQRWASQGPSEKQLRLAEFAVLRCSESSLVKIVNLLKNKPTLADDIGTNPLAESSQAFLAHLSRGPIKLDLTTGGTFDWHIADLDLAIKFFASRNENFRSMLAERLRERPCEPDQPWEIVLYNDEATPGAVLRLDNRRKLVCFYATIKSWGPKIVVHEAAWVPLGFLRHDILQSVRGKLSGVMRHLLRRMFLGDSRLVEGTLVDGVGPVGAPALLFFKLGNLLYDEAACHLSLSTKGASGLFPCVGCKDVYGRLPEQIEEPLSAHDTSSTLRDITCGDPREFDARTDEDLWFAADLLTTLRGRLTHQQFAEQERFLGMTWNPHGLLWDAELRPLCPPIQVHTYDSSHTFFASGIFLKEMGLLLTALRPAGVDFDSVREFMSADWRTCHCLGGGRAPSLFKAVFSPIRARHFASAKEFGCGISEALGVIAPFRFMLDMLPPGAQEMFAPQLKSFAALADAIEVLLLAKDAVPGCADRLAEALHHHAQRFSAAYGSEDKAAYIPKFHFARHIPAQVLRDGFVLDTLVCERYHNRTKNIADPVKNSRNFESSVLGRALQSHLSLLNAPLCFGTGLLEPTDVRDGVQASLDAVFEGTRLREGDLIRLGDSGNSEPLLLRGFFEEDGELFLSAWCLALSERLTATAARWTVGGLRMEPLRGRRLRLCVCWSRGADGRFLILSRGSV